MLFYDLITVPQREVLYFENFNLTDVITPVDAQKLNQLLVETDYNEDERLFVVDGFTNGFSLEYNGNEEVRQTSPNLKFRGVGDHIELWNKVMKEVKLGRYAGPFEKIPFEYYIQSPIGLVPKDSGKDTRLIFHLSYPRNGNSVNANTPAEKCKVKYPDFAKAIRLCLQEGKSGYVAKSDMRSAFRNLGISMRFWRFLLMKAKSPLDGKYYYFVDKCLPFGASISCSHFQRVSNAIAHIVKGRTGRDLVNYLDDYLFAALMKMICNGQVHEFLKVCEEIKFPVSLEKTFWSSKRMVFLGLLIDTINQMVLIPIEKLEKAKDLISSVLLKRSKKLTVNQLQKICGFLNFLGRCVIPGRAFTRRLYSHTAAKPGKKQLLPHHHIRITQDMRLDLLVWKKFLEFPEIFCRPFMDFSCNIIATEINMYSDASKNANLGFGATCMESWMFQRWDSAFIRKYDPSIQYLELFGVLAGVLEWIHRFRNKRIILFCDNISVCRMINNNSSTCMHCMKLIRILVLKGMIENVRISAKYVESKKNFYADALSRMQIRKFKRFGREKFEENNTPVPEEIWPMSKVW